MPTKINEDVYPNATSIRYRRAKTFCKFLIRITEYASRVIAINDEIINYEGHEIVINISRHWRTVEIILLITV